LSIHVLTRTGVDEAPRAWSLLSHHRRPLCQPGHLNDDAELAVAEAALAEAALAEAIAQMPADQRAALPTDEGEPYVEIVQALYRYERPKPGEIRWIEVRELSAEKWDAVIAAHREVYRFTRGLDRFPSFAWGDLRNARRVAAAAAGADLAR